MGVSGAGAPDRARLRHLTCPVLAGLGEVEQVHGSAPRGRLRRPRRPFFVQDSVQRGRIYMVMMSPGHHGRDPRQRRECVADVNHHGDLLRMPTSMVRRSTSRSRFAATSRPRLTPMIRTGAVHRRDGLGNITLLHAVDELRSDVRVIQPGDIEKNPHTVEDPFRNFDQQGDIVCSTIRHRPGMSRLQPIRGAVSASARTCMSSGRGPGRCLASIDSGCRNGNIRRIAAILPSRSATSATGPCPGRVDHAPAANCRSQTVGRDPQRNAEIPAAVWCRRSNGSTIMADEVKLDLAHLWTAGGSLCWGSIAIEQADDLPRQDRHRSGIASRVDSLIQSHRHAP